MNPRVSLTLGICVLAGAIAAVGLFRPDFTTNPATPTAPSAAAADQGEDHSGHSADGVLAPTEAGTINIQDFAFSGIATAQPGQTITVTNLDSAPHTLTAFDGTFDTGNLGPGESVTLTLPSEPGTYEFFCQVHPSMVSTITIQP